MAQKKWSKEQAERRYVQGDRVTLEALASLSGVSISTLKRWSATGGWEQQRAIYQDGLQGDIRAKTAEKISDELSGLLSQLSQEHLEAYQTVRRIVTAKAKRLLEVLAKDLTLAQLHQEISADPNIPEELREKAMKQFDPGEIGNMARTLDICIRGERLVAGLEYESVNAAIAACEKAGLEVKVPAGSVLAQPDPQTGKLTQQTKQK
jgi:hypothetical protein